MPIKVEPNTFQSRGVNALARRLLGKLLVTKLEGRICSGLIVETEAYSHRERGCHAFGNKMTNRNQVMFLEGGHAYVYLCYGIHYMFNVVTNKAGQGDAILIRALEPVEGLEVMMERMGAASGKRITSGPGKLTKAMGIDRALNGAWLNGPKVWLEEGQNVSGRERIAAPRIGIDYAGDDALLPWRHYIAGNEWVSKK